MEKIPQEVYRRQRVMEYCRKHGNISEAARRYGYSRKTLHKWVKRWDGSKESLYDRSRAPHRKARGHSEKELRLVRRLAKKHKWQDIIVAYQEACQRYEYPYKQYTLAHNEYLIIADAGRRLALRHNEVLYVEAQSPYTLIHMQGHAEPIKLRYRFLDLIPKLPEELFILCHRSYLVNIIHVRAVKRHTLTLSTGEELPVSRSLGAHLNDSFDNYYQEGGISHGVDCI